MDSVKITAPAKVNLFLKILGKRRDSYHNILTIFERVSIFDEITISKIPSGIEVDSDRPITPRPEDNLAYKAAQLILGRGRIKNGVKIRIKKRIPIAAGMGGGSSDAASVLKGIDRLFDIGLGTDKLISIAKRLGADVPFFVMDAPFAIGKGRGDSLDALESKVRFWHLIIYPGFELSTKEVYKAFDKARKAGFLSKRLTRKIDGDKIHLPLRCTAMVHNDLEDIAIIKRPVIGVIKRRLASLSDANPIVSGSGPSVFCLYDTRKEAVEAKERLERSVPARMRKGWRIFVARTA